MNYILALDQGTTSSKAYVFNAQGQIIGSAGHEFQQHFPQDGWVEHYANEIWKTQYQAALDAIADAKIKSSDISAIGITNQRETTVLWDRHTGDPLHHAIVWQDRRTAKRCQQLKAQESLIKQKTGLVVDAYFSGTKIEWLLDHVDGARAAAQNGDLCAGTIDSWLLFKLTKGQQHATDVSNASRTQLFNINTLEWDQQLCDLLRVPRNILPEVKESADDYGHSHDDLFDGARIPIHGVAGDQQAALFGQTCFTPGSAKNTYGTGCFMLMNTGTQRAHSTQGLLSTIAWRINGETTYALEGSVFIAGAAIQWLRDTLKIITNAAESESLARKADPNSGVVLVPAFTGLGAPYWDMYARGAIFGLNRNTGDAEICFATLESLAFQTKDVLDLMQQEGGIALQELWVDGGAVANNLLMQFQADVLNIQVKRPSSVQSTARGAAFLAGIGLGCFNFNDLSQSERLDRSFEPSQDVDKAADKYQLWLKAVERSKAWLEE